MRLPLLARLILNVCVLPYDLYEYARDVVLLACGYDKKIFAECQGALVEGGAHDRAVVVAVRPSSAALPFLLSLLKGLRECDFYILVISTKRLSRDTAAAVLPHCHYLIERFPLGRDFGSYKMGVHWISTRASLKNIDTLALVNDSLYYPATMGLMIAELLGQKEDWLCLFENYESLYHAQSFFLVFRTNIIRSAAFARFWKNYPPFSSRLHSIRKGEVGLSRLLQRAGFAPYPLFSSARISRDVHSRLTGTQVAENFRRVMWSILDSKLKLSLTDTNKLLLDFPTNATRSMSLLAESRNPPHLLGLLCNVLYLAPLKRDICYRGHQLMADILVLSEGFTPEEKEAIASDLRAKGVPANFAGLSRLPLRLLYATGRI
jgi:hypothetical protein